MSSLLDIVHIFIRKRK